MPKLRLPSIRGSHDKRARSLQILRPHRHIAVSFYASAAVAAVIPMLQVVVLRQFIDDLASSGRPHRYTLLLSGFCALLLAGTVTSFLSSTLSSTLAYRIIADLQRRMFDRLTTMPLPFYTTVRPGAVVSRMTNDVNGIEAMYTQVLPAIVSSSIAIAVSLVAIGLIEPVMLSLVVLVPVLLAVVRRAESNINKLINESFDTTKQISSATESLVSKDGMLLARQNGRTGDERDRFFLLTRRSTSISSRIARSAATANASYNATFGIMTAVALGVCVSLAVKGELSTGDVVMTALFVQQLQAPVQTLLGTRYPKLRARIAFQRVFDVLDSPVVADRKAIAPAASVQGPPASAPGAVKLEMRGVSFTYPAVSEYSVDGLSQMGDAISIPWLPLTGLSEAECGSGSEQRRQILTDFDLEIRSGQVKAIVGPSGSGKSTVALLAAGMLEPTTGVIKIAGQDLADLTYADLAGRVAFITQDTFVLHDSIRANLRYAKPDATDEEIMDVCTAARLLEFVDGNEEGLDTVVGEKGNRMSGGERQRLAIARALLKKPELVILDEATAHLDQRTEAEVMEAVLRMFSSRAVLVIAHRLKTVTAADEILVVEGGAVIQRGAYAELADDVNGAFSRLSHTAG
jgi:ATP-binding cassette subfamily B protein